MSASRIPRVLGAAAMVAIAVAVHWNHLWEPPAWDAAMGVFPPAVWLHRNGWDLLRLIELPAWQAGGPNVYSLSLVTWITALTLPLDLGVHGHLPALHVAQFTAAAAGLLALHKLARAAFSSRTALLLTAAVGLAPVWHAQTTQLYLEIPLAAASLACLVAVHGRHWRAAAVWAVVAMLCKPTGLVVVATASACALLDPGEDPENASFPQRLGRAIGMSALPLLVLAVNLWAGSKKGASPWHLDYLAYLEDCFHRLRTVADLLIMLAFGGTVAVLALPAAVRSLVARPHPPDPSRNRAVWICVLFVVAWLCFVSAVPLSGRVQPLLPRHVVQLLGPLMIVGAFGASRFVPERVVTAAAIGLCAWFALNTHGRFYPPETRSFAVAERSLAYRDYLHVQRKMAKFINKVPPTTTVIYPLPDHYFLSDPLLGYAPRTDGQPGAASHPSLRFCAKFDAPYRSGRLSDYPLDFIAVHSNPYHGGEALHRVVSEARAAPKCVTKEVVRFARGGYEAAAVAVHCIQ